MYLLLKESGAVLHHIRKYFLVFFLLMIDISFCNAESPISLNFTGNIVASACTVNSGKSNMDINLGDIQASDLSNPGTSSPKVAFSITFTNCPVGTNNVNVIFSGTPDSDAGDSYYDSTGSAGNVAVALYEASTGYLKGNGSNMTRGVDELRNATIDLQANVYSSKGGALPGTIITTVFTTVNYK